MLQNISYFLIFGKPLIFYLGITTLILLISTATIGYLIIKGGGKVPFKWHMWLAAITLIIAAVHGGLGILLYL